jgi:hypothetical protein
MLPPKLNIGPVADAFADGTAFMVICTVCKNLKQATGRAVQLMASPIPTLVTGYIEIIVAL